MRERLDEVEPIEIRKAFKSVFATLQRGKVLEKYVYLEGKYLLLIDGTGYFSSDTARQKKPREGESRKTT